MASPKTVAFGTVPINQSASTTVSLLNGGSAPIEITQLNLKGQSFSVNGSNGVPVNIAAGGTYSLNIQFNPATAGPATGQLTIASNSSTADSSVITLSGTGAAGSGSASLSTLSCSSATLIGSGTDACTLTLTDPAPIDGLTVNFASSNSAVSVPSSVTVPANATSASFVANVVSVETAQTVTITASVGSISKNFTLQLNAAIPSLSINATSVAFGEVVVNSPATQSVTLTSSGAVPVTISGATLTGTVFALSGTTFPATLSPGQAATLNLEFDPVAVGAATGQLTIASNSLTNGTAAIDISGTGTAAPVIAVAVTPATSSVTTGAGQQFAALVTGSPDTTVTWTVSGNGCSGIACGTISSSGFYTAPVAVPNSATVAITATIESNPTKSAAANITIAPPQARGYGLVWEDTFSTLNLCATNVPDCNWYNPGLWWEQPAGAITNPISSAANLEWETGQINDTNISTSSPNGAYFRAWCSGYFEVSMAFDPAIGSAPAIWMLPTAEIGANTSSDGVNYGELDIFEWQSQTPMTFYGTAHVWKNHVDIKSNNNTASKVVPDGTNFDNYNTYGVLWTPTSISWYFNNHMMDTLNTTETPYKETFAGVQSYFMILSQQAGCNWGTTCTGQVSPLNMRVRWVHIYASPTTP